jgi:hypothetical protein
MRKNEPTLQQALAQAQYYRTLFNTMVDLVNFRLGDEAVVTYLIECGYDPEQDLIQELRYDAEFVEKVLEGLVYGYDE